jgi:hypothetical protein
MGNVVYSGDVGWSGGGGPQRRRRRRLMKMNDEEKKTCLRILAEGGTIPDEYMRILVRHNDFNYRLLHNSFTRNYGASALTYWKPEDDEEEENVMVTVVEEKGDSDGSDDDDETGGMVVYSDIDEVMGEVSQYALQ